MRGSGETVVARRYAKALLSLFQDKEGLEGAQQDLWGVSSFLAEGSDLRRVFDYPGVAMARKEQLLTDLIERLGLQQVTASLLRLLLRKGRLSQLPAIAEAFEVLANRLCNRRKVLVTVARELGAEERERLRDHLAQGLHSEVVMEVRLDPFLLAGVVTQIGSLVVDGSLRSALTRMRDRIMEG